MKKYDIELSDKLSAIYEDIARLNQKNVDCLAIILGRVIHTMLKKAADDDQK